MPGPTCRYCQAQCFVYRIVPVASWSGLMATCEAGKADDRAALDGYDADNSINPILEGRAS